MLSVLAILLLFTLTPQVRLCRLKCPGDRRGGGKRGKRGKRGSVHRTTGGEATGSDAQQHTKGAQQHSSGEKQLAGNTVAAASAAALSSAFAAQCSLHSCPDCLTPLHSETRQHYNGLRYGRFWSLLQISPATFCASVRKL